MKYRSIFHDFPYKKRDVEGQCLEKENQWDPLVPTQFSCLLVSRYYWTNARVFHFSETKAFVSISDCCWADTQLGFLTFLTIIFEPYCCRSVVPSLVDQDIRSVCVALEQ